MMMMMMMINFIIKSFLHFPQLKHLLQQSLKK